MPDQDPRDSDLLADLTAGSAEIEVRRIGHATQTNRTYLLSGPEGKRVAKVFAFLAGEKLNAIAEIHRQLAGPPCRAPAPLEVREEAIVFAQVEGVHVVPGSEHLPQLASAFAHQLEALRRARCAPIVTRPRGLPGDLRRLLPSLMAEEARRVEAGWEELSDLSRRLPTRTAHLDWRPDNFIWVDDRLVAVLDWDSAGACSLAEAVAMAAARVSDSRRVAVHPDPALAVSFAAGVRVRLDPAARAELGGQAAHRVAFLTTSLTVLSRLGGGWDEALEFATVVSDALIDRP